MRNILEAVLAGDTSAADYATLELPDHYRAVTVHEDEATMFERVESRAQDPGKALHVEDVALPELRPGEALVAAMASATDYNTVWISISSRSRPSASSSATAGARRSPSSTACPTTSSDRKSPAWCSGPARACTPGSPAARWWRTACPSSWRATRGTTTRCSTPSSGGGLRDQLRWPGARGAGQGQPADARTRAPHLEGGREAPGW